MATGDTFGFDVPGEATYERPPLFQGGEFQTREVFDTIAEVREYTDALTQGYADAFLSDAWKEIRVIRNRDSKGRFVRPAWVVVVVYQRPRPGDFSGGAGPLDPGQVLEYR